MMVIVLLAAALCKGRRVPLIKVDEDPLRREQELCTHTDSSSLADVRLSQILSILKAISLIIVCVIYSLCTTYKASL
jgi:hypothetical protein